MGLKLIIAEKPSVAKSISNAINGSYNIRRDGYYEGKDYIVTFVFGHMYELYSAKEYDSALAKWDLINYPYFPKEFKYKPKDDNGVKKQLKIIKSLTARPDIEEIIIGTDNDMEGELIGNILAKELSFTKPMKRLLINSHTPEEVRKGMSGLKDYKDLINFIKASYCRQHMDWCIGISYTVLASVCYLKPNENKIPSRNINILPVGRVLLPTLKLIYDRNNEIINFKKERYFELKVFFNTTSKNEQYIGFYMVDKETKFKNITVLEKVKNDIQNKSGIITEKESDKIIENAPLLFNLTDLQGHISSKYNISSDKVKEIAQELYEKGYITYPRTASRHLDATQTDEAERVLNVLSKDFPSEYKIVFKKDKRIFDSSKVDSHPGLIPTYLIPTDLSEEQAYVYEEIKKRFLALFMPPNEYESTTIVTAVDTYNFVTREKVLVKDGWIKLYKESSQIKNESLNVKVNDIVKVIHLETIEKETEPPKQYTEKTLLKAMENCGKNVSDEDMEHILKGYSIGTPDTRSETIKKLLKIGYVEKKGKSLLITDLGKEIVEVFPVKELLDTDFTGRIQKSLKDIEKGTVNSDIFMERMKAFIKNSAAKFKEIEFKSIKTNEQSDRSNDISIGKCPDCGSEIIVGKKAYGCSNWKNGCKFSIWFSHFEKLGLKKINKSTAKKLINGDKVALKLVSKNNKPFECLGYLVKENEKWSIKLEFNN